MFFVITKKDIEKIVKMLDKDYIKNNFRNIKSKIIDLLSVITVPKGVPHREFQVCFF